jgi:nitrite reductase/ring-hydroxylating ferredoxin subunit
MERITDLTAPPIVGRRYLVPTIKWPHYGYVREWPVFPIRHSDVEFLNFANPHYHVDPRFVGIRAWRAAVDWGSWSGLDETAFSSFQRAPLCRDRLGEWARDPGHALTWSVRRCHRAEIPYQHHDKASIQALAKHFDGHQAKRGARGWVCPHKRFALGSIVPDAEGVLTCPLHGLRIAADTGRCLGPTP